MLAGANTGISASMPINQSVNSIVDVQSKFAAAMAKLGLDLSHSYLTALSGGADSSALSLLTQQYANAAGKGHHAVIIDHGLRDHSYSEACRVRDRMHSHGITSDIISINSPRPTSGFQEWARSHRHRILMSAARDRQSVLLFAHHADDQAETIAMRLLKGSGLVGLAGIPSIRAQHGVIISRPLLDWSHDELLEVCCHFGHAFEDDPSNRNRQFERVRIRQLSASLASLGEEPSSGQLRRLGVLSAKLSTAATNANANSYDKAVNWHYAGYATTEMKHLADLSKFRWAMIMRRLVMAVSGSEHAPSRAAIDELHKRIDAGLSATIGGCHFSPVQKTPNRGHNDPEESPAYRLFRETGRYPRAITVGAGDELVFAGCWLVKSVQAGTLHALADAHKIWDGLGLTMVDKNMPEDWHLIPHRARKAIPVLTTLDGGLIYPQLIDYNKNKLVAQLAAQFLGMAQDPRFPAYTMTSDPR